MTNEELKTYYASLLIMQYSGKPNANATIKALVDMAIMDQLPVSLADCFNIDTAVGVQLDLLGKYVGVTRIGKNFSGPMILTDDQFRQYIKIKIIQNSSGSSLYEIQNLLAIFFPDSLHVFDYQNMQMSYTFDSSIGTRQLAEFFVEAGVLPRPMGVQLSSVIYIPTFTNIFSFRTYDLQEPGVKGFNSYSSYQTNWPWIQYSDVIVL